MIESNGRDIKGSLEKLSSGLRINKAADDSSGLQIANSLRSDANTINQSIKNANDALSIIAIADKSIEQQVKLTDLIKQKTIQSAQDGQTEETRKALQKDIDKLLSNIDDIANQTKFNGKSLLSGEFTNKKFVIGSYTSTTEFNIGSTNSSKIGQTSFYKSDTTNIISGFGEVDLKFLNVDGLRDVDIASVVLSTSAGTGLGALAEEINKSSSLTGIRATYDVVHKFSNKETMLTSGETSENFAINGVTIGQVAFEDADRTGALVNTINDFTTQTGVTAFTTAEGYLRLGSVDGRGIKIDNMYEADTDGLLGADGDPRVNVSWYGTDDLDIVVVDPNGEAIGYHASTHGTVGGGPTNDNHTTSTDGEWDRDDTGSGGLSQENFYWDKDSVNVPEGEYEVYVKGFSVSAPVDFTVTIITNGKKREIGGTLSSTGDENRYTFEYYKEQYESIGELTLTKTNGSAAISISGTNLELLGMGSDDEINKYVSTLSDIRVISSAATRNDSISIVDSAINSLDSIRGALGSTHNNIISKINNLSSLYVNVKNSESNIRDVDFASESANFQKSNILAQAGSFAFAQAQQNQQKVAQLLM
jgi:flagellin